MVRIHQVEAYAPYVHSPDISVNGIVGERHLHYHLLARLRVNYFFNRQGIKVLCFIIGYLLAIHRDCLIEIAVPIKQAHATEVYIGIGCLLQIITCQYSQAAGINFQYMIETILHAEVGNGRTGIVRLLIHVVGEFAIHLIHPAEKVFVLSQSLEGVIAHVAKHLDRILSAAAEEFRIH